MKHRAKAAPSPDAPPFVVIPRGAKPSKAVSTDDLRPALWSGYLRKTNEEWQLLVTDSYGLARIPVEVVNANGTDPAEGAVPFAALKQAEKTGGFRSDNETVEPCSRDGKGSDVLYRRDSKLKGPDWDVLLSDDKRPKKPFRVGLNTRILRQVAEALGTDAVELEFDPTNNLSRIRVRALGGEERVGLLMPVRLNP